MSDFVLRHFQAASSHNFFPLQRSAPRSQQRLSQGRQVAMHVPPTSFELFPSLPVELRSKIFEAAIQPRFVRIEKGGQAKTAREVASYEAMIKLAHEKIAQMDLRSMHDPPETFTKILAEMLGSDCRSEVMLQHFRRMQTPYITSRTESTTRTPVYRTSANGVDWCLLDRDGIAAMKLAMQTFKFWSWSPIPALLHTCRESRHTMQIFGYELSFPTDDDATPVVWFNFKFDALDLTYLNINEVRQLPSRDLARIRRLAVKFREEFRVQLLSELLPVAMQLRELLCVVHQFCPPDRRRRPIDTENNLWGYLECDTSEFVSHSFLEYARQEYVTFEAWREIAQPLVAYQRKNGGSTDGFFAVENDRVENQIRMFRDDHHGSWAIPECKHVFMVTKEQASWILAFRERFNRDMKDLERLENEEGPRVVSNHPFDDEYDVLYERDVANTFRPYY